MALRPSGTSDRVLRCGLLMLVACSTGIACRTARPDPAADRALVTEAARVLDRPTPGDMAALYELAVPSSGGLRLTVLQLGDGGRITVNEPFGTAVSAVEWGASGATTFIDFRQGCRLEESDLVEVLGVGALPVNTAVRMLGGRLPAGPGDRVAVDDGGRLTVTGSGWSAVVTVAAEPWRVTRVEEIRDNETEGWRIRLNDHSGSVPGWIRFEGGGRRWAELSLLRLQWNTVDELPSLPRLPACGRGEGDG